MPVRSVEVSKSKGDSRVILGPQKEPTDLDRLDQTDEVLA